MAPSDIAASLAAVRRRMDEASRRAGRDPADVRLVAVTKGQPGARVREAFGAGVRDVGENRVEEGLPKRDGLADLADLRWHMVGRVQSRKARRVAEAFDVVHSVDRIKLARHLDRGSAEAGRILPILLECSLSGEQAKAGWKLEGAAIEASVLGEWEEISRLPNLQILGLMTLAPWGAPPPVLRQVFGGLRSALAAASARIPGTWRELSMGMTDDFEVAIEEGATLVRIGRAIFEPGAL